MEGTEEFGAWTRLYVDSVQPLSLLNDNLELSSFVAESSIASATPLTLFVILRSCVKRPVATRPKFGQPVASRARTQGLA